VLADATAGADAGTAAAGDDGSDASLVGAEVPVTACGNGVGVLGDARGTCATAAGASGGNGSTADVDAPVTACGNGVGVLGDARGTCTTAAGTDGPGTLLASGRPGDLPGAGFPGVLAPARSALPVAADGGPGASGAAATGGQLAYTGGTVVLPLVAGLLALALGLGLTLASRHRRTVLR
jgi:hypothetical protein